MGRQGQTTLRMIWWSDTMKAPEFPREHAIGILIALAPPLVPDASKIVVRAGLRARKFSGQQAAESEESRLQCEGLRAVSRPTGAQFGQALHRPNIFFIPERAKEPFPKGLFPIGLFCASTKLRRFAFQPDLCRLMKQLCHLLRFQFTQGRATFTPQLFGKRLRSFAAKPEAKFTQGRI